MRPSLPDTVYADYSDLQASDPLVGVRRFRGAANIARAMMRYGALTCGITTTVSFQTYGSLLWSSEGVYTGKAPAGASMYDVEDMTAKVGGHSVACYGFGTTASGVPYWECLNSWGADWGADGRGAFKLKRGDDALGMDGTDIATSQGCYDVQLNAADVHTGGLHADKPPTPAVSPPPPYVAPPPSRYVEVHAGTCASQGYAEITSVQQCRYALEDSYLVVGAANMTGEPPKFPLAAGTITRDPHKHA